MKRHKRAAAAVRTYCRVNSGTSALETRPVRGHFRFAEVAKSKPGGGQTTGRGEGRDFIESLARGLDVIKAFGHARRALSLNEVAEAAAIRRPSARRLLLTLAELGYVQTDGDVFSLTPQVLELGVASVSSLGQFDIARPHLERLVALTGESVSMARLDGRDIEYVALVAVPKIIMVRIEIGTRFPAELTSQGKVLLAALAPDELDHVLSLPTRSGLHLGAGRPRAELDKDLEAVAEQGWALSDGELAPGLRSVAVPVPDGSGKASVAMNIAVYSAETSVQRLIDEYLPTLQRTADDITEEWTLVQSLPQSEVPAPGDLLTG